MRRVGTGLAAMLLASCTAAADVPAPGNQVVTEELARLTQPATQHDPKDLQVLFWSDQQRLARFREMENWFAGYEVTPKKAVRNLPLGKPLSPELTAAFRADMAKSHSVGLMVLQDGRIRMEEYREGFAADQRWTSFSVAKSFTSTLLGAAVRDGYIGNMQDAVTAYIPELKGSAYDEVTVEDLATMSSGVKWNEDYADPKSDVAQMGRFLAQYGGGATIAQMKALPHDVPPGTKWNYSTGETNLIGVLVEKAVGVPLAAYAKEHIVDAAGFEAPLFWMTDGGTGNVGGCCLSLRLADYARFGQFVLEGGGDVVPDGWFAAATAPRRDFGPLGRTGYGYGYQWWAYPQKTFGAQGIFGQSITIDPANRIVVVELSNWPTASNAEYRASLRALIARIPADK